MLNIINDINVDVHQNPSPPYAGFLSHGGSLLSLDGWFHGESHLEMEYDGKFHFDNYDGKSHLEFSW